MPGDEGKVWALVHLHSLRGADYWQISIRKLTCAEIDKLFDAGHYSKDFFELGLSYAMSGSLISEIVTFGGSRRKAEEIVIRLNHGEDPLTMVFGDGGQDE